MNHDPERFSFYFGAFRLDPEAAELHRGEQRIELRPKCFHLLLYLVRNPRRLLSRETLLEEIWKDVVVGQETLSRTVTEIRQALGDDADEPQYIETVPGQGYKFIAEVTQGHRASPHTAFVVHRHREYPLPEGEHVIGRDQDAAVRLYAPRISRHHARIRVAPNQLTIEDLGSKNGTLVNGLPVRGVIELQSGDTIDVGGEQLVVRSASDSTLTGTLERADPNASR